MDKVLEDIFELLLRKDLPFSFYFSPHEGEMKLIVQASNNTDLSDEILKSNDSGFIYRSFDKRRKPKFIRADYSGNIEDFTWQKFESLTDGSEISQPKINIVNDLEKIEYLKRVDAIVDRIEKEEVKKMVLSRVKTVSHDKSPVEIFLALHLKNPSAFTYLLRTDNGQIWLGASPEIILEKSGSRFNTVALAGTVLNEESEDLFSPKNIEEQVLVQDYILSKLEKSSAKNIKHKQPKAHVAVNVTHIKTEISFDLSRSDVEDVINLAEELHPTPAVGGLPEKIALKFIEEFENHDRELYAGYLGPINLFGETALYVNIRNAQYFEGHLRIYVGGGIIKGSDSEMEWQETENKSYVMGQAIL
ncbi:MAG: isochorismate synthase [Urechidicola sp.]|jgi:isochorismate synthase